MKTILTNALLILLFSFVVALNVKAAPATPTGGIRPHAYTHRFFAHLRAKAVKARTVKYKLLARHPKHVGCAFGVLRLRTKAQRRAHVTQRRIMLVLKHTFLDIEEDRD